MNAHDTTVTFRLMAAAAPPIQDLWNLHSCLAVAQGWRHTSHWHVGQRFGVYVQGPVVGQSATVVGGAIGHITNKWIQEDKDLKRHVLSFELTWRDPVTKALVRQSGVQDAFAAAAKFFWLPTVGELLEVIADHTPDGNGIEAFCHPDGTAAAMLLAYDKPSDCVLAAAVAQIADRYGSVQQALLALAMKVLDGWTWNAKRQTWAKAEKEGAPE